MRVSVAGTQQGARLFGLGESSAASWVQAARLYPPHPPVRIGHQLLPHMRPRRITVGGGRARHELRPVGARRQRVSSRAKIPGVNLSASVTAGQPQSSGVSRLACRYPVVWRTSRY